MRVNLHLAVVLFLSSLVARASSPLVITDCDEVEVMTEDPAQEKLASRLSKVACRRTRELVRLFKTRPGVIRIRICADMEGFRKRSGRPWYIGAVLVGDEIITQPARSLFKMVDMESVLAHELVHLMIRRTAGRNCPRWLDEGLAQWLSGQKAGLTSGNTRIPENEIELAALESRLGREAKDRKRLEEDYRISLVLAHRLIGRIGLTELLGALPGFKKVEQALLLTVRGKPLKDWICFGGDCGR